ncbi:putative aminoadipate reductase [Suillus subluteus]|nr:putative aminoadipate reductase [Suillus subluteus]
MLQKITRDCLGSVSVALADSMDNAIESNEDDADCEEADDDEGHEYDDDQEEDDDDQEEEDNDDGCEECDEALSGEELDEEAIGDGDGDGFSLSCSLSAQAIRPASTGADKEVVALITNSDTLLYQTVVFMGIIFAGLVPFPMSPCNSAAAVTSMMQKTRCHCLIMTQHSLASLIDGVKAGLVSSVTQTNQLQIDEIPALNHLYPMLVSGTPNETIVLYSSPLAGLPSSENDILFYLHTSGSTGFPKPIPITNLTAIHWCIMYGVALGYILEHIDVPAPIRIGTVSLPSFHTFGVSLQLLFPIATLNVVPAFLAQWTFLPSTVDDLKTQICCKFAIDAFHGGSPLAPKIGNALVNAGVKLSSGHGTTECGIITCQRLWDWTTPTHQVSVENLLDVKGYATSDVFIKHPAIEGLWKIIGRINDVLILSSGEKTVPAPMESVICANPYVNSTIIFRRGHNQVGILIGPRAGCEIDVDDGRQLAEFRNQVRPDIQEANKEAPAFSRIFKETILVTHRTKPMFGARKGTITKKATVELYEVEIDAIYEKVEGSTKAGIDVPLPTSWTAEDVEEWLKIYAAAVNANKAVDSDTDLFAQGLTGGLSATFLKNHIIDSLSLSSDCDVQASTSWIDQNIIFSSPSICWLMRSVVNVVLQQNGAGTIDPKADIENTIERYSVGLGNSVTEANTTPANRCNQSDHVVALTGSTGGLESYLLADLLKREDVSVEDAFNDRGLGFTLLRSDKLVYVETDTSDDHLGLDKELYQKIRMSVTVIIHNAWRLDFNLVLSSFDSHVQGMRNLIDLALSSPRHPKPCFMLAYSILSAQSWGRAKGPFPEQVEHDAGVAGESGATSWGMDPTNTVFNKILVNSKLPVTSFRIGQASGGPPLGAWSTTNWVLIFIKSTQGFVSWIPPHAISNAILDVAFAEEEPPVVMILVHLRPTTWKPLIQSIANTVVEHKITSYPLPFVPFSKSLDRVPGTRAKRL